MAFKGLRFAGLEIKDIVSSSAMKVVLAAISIIPCLYGALYLCAFFDPYNTLKSVPVAIVNEDAGALIQDEERNVGEEVCNTIESRSGGMQWNFVSADEAREGMEAGKYYMICTIPEDFSECVASVDTHTPEHAQMIVTYDQSQNMLASQIGATVWTKVQKAVNDAVAEEYWNTTLQRTNEAGSSLSSASDGAQQLADGLRAAQEGTDALSEGMGGMAAGVVALQSGMGALASGADSLGAGMVALSGGSGALTSGAGALTDGLSQVNQQTAALPQQTSQLAQGAAAVNEGMQEASAGSAQLAAGSQAVTDGLGQLNAGLGLVRSSAVGSLVSGLELLGSSLESAASLARASADAVPDTASHKAELSAAAAASNDVTSKIQSAQGSVASAQEALSVDTTGMTSEQIEAIKAAQAYLDTASSTLTASDVASQEVGAAIEASAAHVPQTDALKGQLTMLASGLEHAAASVGDTNDSVRQGDATLFAAANGIEEGLAAAQASIGSASVPAQTLAYGSAQVTQGLGGLGAGLAAAQQGTESLSGATGALAAAMPALSTGLGQLAQGAQALTEGLSAYTGGVDVIAQSMPAFAQGAQAAASGTGALVSGAQALQAGSAQLGEGIGVAADGNQALADSLSEGAGEMKMAKSEIEEKSEVMSAPVELKEETYTEVKNYGTGFAPYFIALGLWVGCLVAGFAIRPMNPRLIASGANPVAVAFSGYVPLAAFVLVQAAILLMVLQFGLGLQIEHVPQYYAFGFLTALVFTAILQLFMAAFGFPGKFLGIIVLMLQLTSCAGTFPIETAPAFFQVISPFMPMTYVVEGMRQIMTGIGFNVAASAALVLAAMGACSFALTAVVAWRKRTIRMETLHPVIRLG